MIQPLTLFKILKRAIKKKAGKPLFRGKSDHKQLVRLRRKRNIAAAKGRPFGTPEPFSQRLLREGKSANKESVIIRRLGRNTLRFTGVLAGATVAHQNRKSLKNAFSRRTRRSSTRRT